MPALTPDANLWQHIFKPSDTSGFHSKAKWSEIADDKKPQIHRTHQATPPGMGFYLCGWNFAKNADGLKWSTMFPDLWGAPKVEQAVTDAIAYWNNLGTTGTENADRVKRLVQLYGVGWIGNAKVDGHTVVIGGMSGQNKALSAFPMIGANANFPQPPGVQALYRQ